MLYSKQVGELMLIKFYSTNTPTSNFQIVLTYDQGLLPISNLVLVYRLSKSTWNDASHQNEMRKRTMQTIILYLCHHET
jgi:hypothetical protein